MGVISKIFKNAGAIAEGIRNSIFKKAHIEEAAAERMAICQDCEFIDREGKSCVVPKTEPCCSDCGCCLELKTRALSAKCGKGKWPALMSQEEEDLLKEKLDYKD